MDYRSQTLVRLGYERPHLRSLVTSLLSLTDLISSRSFEFEGLGTHIFLDKLQRTNDRTVNWIRSFS